MRCLTLADGLKKRGAECQFICREHPGNLIDMIQGKGFVVHSLPSVEFKEDKIFDADAGKEKSIYRSWLGVTQMEDSIETSKVLAGFDVDWLVVDHYALDSDWERVLSRHCRKTMVIDDLADRAHHCHLLIDQTYDRSSNDYRLLVPQHCQLLCGSQYALLRTEFAELRQYSLRRRSKPELRKLLIAMGGVDNENVTGTVLNVMQDIQFLVDCELTIILGATSPWRLDIEKQAQNMPLSTNILVDVPNMAHIMAESDLAIGAGGSTSWERCCLGLPAILYVLAKNQEKTAMGLGRVGAVRVINDLKCSPDALSEILIDFHSCPEALADLSRSSALITEGKGTEIVIDALESSYG